MHHRWRFTKTREGKRGGPFVKVNHWPSLVVSRQSGFGWRMEVLLLPHNALMNTSSTDSILQRSVSLQSGYILPGA